VALFSRTSLSFIERKVGSDLRLSMHDPNESGLEDEIRATPGVEKVAGACTSAAARRKASRTTWSPPTWSG
jgi:hypothetical protein